MSFSSNDNPTQHKLVHTRDKPRACEIRKSRYTPREAFIRHQNIQEEIWFLIDFHRFIR